MAAVKSAGGTSAQGKKLLAKATKLTDDIKKRTDKLQSALEHTSSNAVKHAKYLRDAVIPAMAAVRATSDILECMIPHGQWPLATYREMLFIKSSASRSSVDT